MIKERSSLVLKELLQNNLWPTPVSKLAEKLNVSERSIRYDLKEIEDEIAGTGIKMNKKPRIGVWLEGNKEACDNMMLKLADLEKQSYYHQDQRVDIISVSLLLTDEPTIMKTFEIDLRVTDSTVFRDMDIVQEHMKASGLTLKKKQNTGVWIEGGEWERRLHLFQLFYKKLVEKKRITSLQELNFKVISSILPENKRFVAEKFESERKQIEKILKDSHSSFTEASLISLFLQLFIIKLRSICHTTVQLDDILSINVQRNSEYDISKRLTVVILSGSSLNENQLLFENCYMTIHLLSSRTNGEFRIPGSLLSSLIHDERELQASIEKVIAVAEGFLGVTFNQDEYLRAGLASHIKPMLYRMRYKIPVERPDFSNLEDQYPGIYMATAAGVKVLEDVYKLLVPSEEIAYLAIYIGAALERASQNETTQCVNVVLICDTGYGTAQLLRERIKNLFPSFNIVKVIAKKDLSSSDSEGVDMYLSTVPVDIDDKQNVSKPVVETTPLLNYLDLININASLENRTVQLKNVIEDITDRIVKKADMLGLSHPSFKNEIKNILSNVNPANNYHDVIIGSGRQKMLGELLKPGTVSIIDGPMYWEEAVRQSGRIMEEINMIEPSYTEAMVDSIKNNGPYMIIAPGIALLHARPEDGVNDVCMSLQIVKQGVSFGHKERDPVDLIFAFGAKDTESHLLALSQLMNLFNDQDKLNQLRQAVDVKEVHDLILTVKSREV